MRNGPEQRDDDKNDAAETKNGAWKRPFLTVWAGQSISLVGSWLVQFAIAWWLTLETRSATVLAIAMIATIVPQVAVGPLAGALVDRWSRKRVMILSDLVVALGTLTLVILFWIDLVEVWAVISVLLVGSAGSAFQRPAFTSSISLMVPKEQLSRVNGINQAIFGIGNIGAPAFGALLLALLPMYGVLAVDICTAIVAISTVIMTRIPQPQKTEGGKESVAEGVSRGFRFVRKWPGALTLIIMAMILNFLLAPTEALLPILTIEHYAGGASEFAAFQASIGLGMILGGVVLGVWGGFRKKMVTVAGGLAVSGIGMAIPGIMPQGLLPAALGGVFIVGFFISMVNASINAILQASVPADMQGRVFALLGSASMAMSPLGLMVAGPASDLLGPQLWYVMAGAVTVAIGIGGFAMQSVMSLEDGPPADAEIVSK